MVAGHVVPEGNSGRVVVTAPIYAGAFVHAGHHERRQQLLSLFQSAEPRRRTALVVCPFRGAWSTDPEGTEVGH